MFARVLSVGLSGLDGFPVEVEVHVSRGLPGLVVVGLPASAVKEAKDRLVPALAAVGVPFPAKKIRINLAPADVRKEGSALDLAMAVGILAALGAVPERAVQGVGFLGELSLDGRLRPVPGVLPCALAAREAGFSGLVVPRDNGPEAGVVDGLSVYPAASLGEVMSMLTDGFPEPIRLSRQALWQESPAYPVDMAEVRGQAHAKRALLVAAAGGHNVLMVGPPGGGKTMLARRLPTILPPLRFEEALEVTKIYSVAGLLPPGRGLVVQRPFRAPHHTISEAGLIGGGSVPRPGEISLAHHGVLFLDEFPEFSRSSLEALRQPMEDGVVTVSRARGTITFPARFILVAAMNPCPCGHYGDPRHVCTCSPGAIRRYRARISGPILDRIDIHLDVPALTYDEMRKGPKGESSAQIRERVVEARERQARRFRGRGFFVNAHMSQRDLDDFCRVDEAGEALLRSAMQRLGLSARAITRALKVARTIADLDAEDKIRAHHLAEAIQYRSMDREGWLAV